MTTPADLPVVDAPAEQPVVDAPVQDVAEGDQLVVAVDPAIAPPETPEVETPVADAPVADATPEPTPEPAPAPAVPEVAAPATPSELEFLRQQNQTLQNQAQQQALESQRLQLEQETQQLEVQLESQGVLPETAVQIAQQQRQIREQSIQAQGQMQAQQAYLQGKMNAALHYGQKHGVDPQTLMLHNTPQEMENAAVQSAEISGLKAQIAQLTKDKVPAQEFSTPSRSAGGPLDGAALEQAVGEGIVDMTPDVMQRLAAWQKSQGFGG